MIVRVHCLHHRRPMRTIAAGVALMLLSCVIQFGCETERVVTSDGRPLPEPPRAVPDAPPTARVNRMALMVGSKPEDSNGNGYPNLIRATVALFAHPHPTSVRAEGIFVFTLWGPGDVGRPHATPIAQWRVEPEDVRRVVANAIYGPAYLFQLDLTAATGGDQFQLASADLRCAFHPADGGAPVTSDGVRSIQIGRRVSAN